MRRRAFIAALGGAVAWPVAARGQRTGPVVGVLGSVSPGTIQQPLARMLSALNEAGLVDGRNLFLEYRWANGQYDQLPVFAADFVSRQVDLIIALGGTALAAKAATQTIPIVALFGGDPVAAGLVAKFNRPGANVTGVTLLAFSFGPKRLELLRELPEAKVITVLTNPTMVEARPDTHDVEVAARAVGQHIQILSASTDQEIDGAFEAMKDQKANALLVMADPFFNQRREQIVSLATRQALPGIYEWRQFAELGGLMSFGSSLADAYYQLGLHAAKVIRGEKVAELPVYQTVKVELVLNLRTAKKLGVTFPRSLLGRADEVIE